jgi:hydrogenase nickel incorporation protein HypA/HybF
MHELSIAQEIMRIVESERARHGFQTVSLVHVRAGALSGVDPGALALSWEAVCADTFAAGSRVEVDLVEGLLTCRDCGARTAADALPEKCPECGSLRLHLDGATGLDIVSLEVE